MKKPRDETITFKADRKLKDDLEGFCKNSAGLIGFEVTVSAFCRQAVQEKLQKLKKT
ncbi:hypothetical protein ACFL5G_01150 [Candidatus Margulisiibacteriota bacterium]